MEEHLEIGTLLGELAQRWIEKKRVKHTPPTTYDWTKDDRTDKPTSCHKRVATKDLGDDVGILNCTCPSLQYSNKYEHAHTP